MEENKITKNYILKDVESGAVIKVSKDVIDFLELHDIYWDANGIKHYKIGRMMYLYIKQ